MSNSILIQDPLTLFMNNQSIHILIAEAYEKETWLAFLVTMTSFVILYPMISVKKISERASGANTSGRGKI